MVRKKREGKLLQIIVFFYSVHIITVFLNCYRLKGLDMYHAHVIWGSCVDLDADKPDIKQTFIRTEKM